MWRTGRKKEKYKMKKGWKEGKKMREGEAKEWMDGGSAGNIE